MAVTKEDGMGCCRGAGMLVRSVPNLKEGFVNFICALICEILLVGICNIET